MKLTFHKTNDQTQKVLRRASFALLREAIHDTRRTLDNINTRSLDYHLQLTKRIHPVLWSTIDQLAEFRAETEATLTTEKQKKKFEFLRTQQKPRTGITTIDSSKVVHNLSTQRLDDASLSVLAKGFNYAVTPKNIPIEDIICGVESAISKMERNTAEIIRQDVSHALRTARPTKRNLTREETKALRELQKNTDIIILPADKGNATVVLDSNDYRAKIEALLDDPAYKVITTDPITYLEKTTKSKIKNSPIEEEVKQQLIPREKSTRCPKLYGLPKIHKEGAPLRPIVSSIGSALQPLARYLARQLQPYAEEAESYVKNSSHFIERLSNVTIQPEHLLVSFDVVSLFTNVPIDEALRTIQQRIKPPEHIISLASHCLKNTYFIYNDQRYKQIDGAPMGSPLSPVIANLFMEDLEERALNTATYKPDLWLRYVDDTFVIWRHGRDHLNTFLAHLNSIHQKIKFTMEIEENNQLPFLDTLIEKRRDGHLSHTVYRKPTHTGRYLNAQSHHHPAQLHSVVSTLVTRSKRLADETHADQEMEQLRRDLLQNGFPEKTIRKSMTEPRPKPQQGEEKEKPAGIAYLPYIKGTTDRISRILRGHNIETTFKTDRMISSILRNPKTKIPLESQGVYEIPCMDCERSYVGQTNRKISVRREEHRNSVRKNEETSSLMQHARNTTHRIDFDSTKVLASIEHITSRIIREAIEIEKRPNNLNTRDDTQRLPTAWKPLLADKRITTERRPVKTREEPTKREESRPTVAGPQTRSRTRTQQRDTTTIRHDDVTSHTIGGAANTRGTDALTLTLTHKEATSASAFSPRTTRSRLRKQT